VLPAAPAAPRPLEQSAAAPFPSDTNHSSHQKSISRSSPTLQERTTGATKIPTSSEKHLPASQLGGSGGGGGSNVRTNWLAFPDEHHQTVIVTRSQINSGTMSIPAGRAQAMFSSIGSSDVTLIDGRTGNAFTAAHKRYPSQPTQVFLQSLRGKKGKKKKKTKKKKNKKK